MTNSTKAGCKHCGSPRPSGYPNTCGNSECQEQDHVLSKPRNRKAQASAPPPTPPAPLPSLPKAERVVYGITGGCRAVFPLRTRRPGERVLVEGREVRLLHKADVRLSEECWSYTEDLTSPLTAAKPVVRPDKATL